MACTQMYGLTRARSENDAQCIPRAIAFHPLISPSLAKQKIGFGRYRYIMAYPQWNRALAWIRKARAWDNGITGARLLLKLTERFGQQLTQRQHIRHEIQLYLFLLDTLRRAQRLQEYEHLWSELRKRGDLTITYRAGSPAGRSEYVIRKQPGYVEVNLLWLHRRIDRR